MLLYMATCLRGAFELHSRAGLVRHALDICPLWIVGSRFSAQIIPQPSVWSILLVVPAIVYLLSFLSKMGIPLHRSCKRTLM